MKKILMGGLMAAVLVGGAWYFLHSEGIAVKAVLCQRGLVEETYTAEGNITFGNEYRILSEVSGAVEKVCVEENSYVDAGTVLMKVASTDYVHALSVAKEELSGLSAQLEQTKINQMMTTSPQEYLSSVQKEMETAQAAYEAAKRVYDSDTQLFNSGFVTQVDLDADKSAYELALGSWENAKQRYEASNRFWKTLQGEGFQEATLNQRFYQSEQNQLQAQIAAQNANIQNLEDKVKKCEIIADKAGVVSDFSANELSMIASGEPVCVIHCIDTPRVEADVLTNVVPYLQVGDPIEASISLHGQKETYSGHISQIYDYASKGVSALGLNEYRVHIKADMDANEVLENRNGYGVNVKFRLYHNENCLSVPSTAVFKENEQHYVYVIENGVIHKTPISVEYASAKSTVVAGGLEENTPVVANTNLEGITDGVEVQIVEE